MMMLIIDINSSYSKILMVVDSQWIKDLLEIQSTPYYFYTEKIGIFCPIHITKENSYVIKMPQNVLQQLGV
jgi:hypothetical protein